MKTGSGIGVAMVLLAAALWGTTGTSQVLAGASLPSVWFGALRLVVAGGFFAACAIVAARRNAGAPHPSPTSSGGHGGPALHRPGLLAAGVCMAVYNLAFFAGLREAGVAVGTAVAIGSGPVWAGLLQLLVARQVPSGRWWLGTLLAITGMVLMTTTGADPTARVGATGIGLCLLSGLAYAAYSLVTKRLVAAAPAATVTLWAFATAAALALPAAWMTAEVPVLGKAEWAAIGYVGVMATGVAYLLFSHALRHISAATGVTLALGEPVMAFALAVLVVGERTSGAALGGLALVIVGVYVVARAELSRPPAGRTVRALA